MSLESKIEQLTAAVEGLTKAFLETRTVITVGTDAEPEVKSAETKDEAKAEPKAEKAAPKAMSKYAPKNTPPVDAPAETEQPKAETEQPKVETEPAEAEPTVAVTREMTSAKVVALAAVNREAALGLMTKHGVKRVADLPPGKLFEVYFAALELLEAK
jgi:outer membrane biosynthesis protein TonB